MSENPADLSVLALFDDLTRCTSVLTDGASDEVFLAFLHSYQDIKRAYCHGTEEIQRLQQELDEALTSISNLETKLNNARRLHDLENRMRKKAENERDDLERKMRICREFLINNGATRDDETRSKLAFLNSPRRRRSFFGDQTIDEEEEPGRLGYGNTTGSLLSDMSVTVSEEDFLEQHHEKGQKRTKSARSDGTPSLGKRFRLSSDARRRSSHRTMEVDAADKIIASTKVTVPQGDGPIVAESIIEARPPEEEQQEKFYTPKKGKSPSRRVKPMAPSAPPMEDLTSLEEPMPKRKDHEEIVYATVHKQATPTNVHRQHHFTPKTHFGGDSCGKCTKRIRFGTSASKCRDCRVLIHTGCASTFNTCCMPAHRMPSDNGPMVPPLIVLCVSEIEQRGLTEVGVYRVSGSEKEVKALKEKFLRGKVAPQLNNVDVHVLCGTVKDFLRSLPEPLLPRAQWSDFCNAIQNSSPQRAQLELFDAIESMPQANRDTLAFLIQHFQRIAQVPEVKMPIGNIAKVFAPTIVGTTNSGISNQHAVLAEINIQVSILEALLSIPTKYWMQFVMYDSSSDGASKQTAKYTVTPMRKPRDKKYYDTPPFYPKK